MKRSVEDIASDIRTLGFITACICRIDDEPTDNNIIPEAGFFIERSLDRLAEELLEVSE